MNWGASLDEHEASFLRLDDSLDAEALQDRREQIDRISSERLVTDDQALAGGSIWLSMLALAAGVATICVVALAVHILGGH